MIVAVHDSRNHNESVPIYVVRCSWRSAEAGAAATRERGRRAAVAAVAAVHGDGSPGRWICMA